MSILLGEPLVPLLAYTMVRVVVDATEIIRYVESGLTGHLNDAQTVGVVFYLNRAFFGDKIYPNSNCIMTPYAAAQLARKEDRVKRKCKKLNYYRNIRYYRIGVEHAFAELKQYIYKITSSAW